MIIECGVLSGLKLNRFRVAAAFEYIFMSQSRKTKKQNRSAPKTRGLKIYNVGRRIKKILLRIMRQGAMARRWRRAPSTGADTTNSCRPTLTVPGKMNDIAATICPAHSLRNFVIRANVYATHISRSQASIFLPCARRPKYVVPTNSHGFRCCRRVPEKLSPVDIILKPDQRMSVPDGTNQQLPNMRTRKYEFRRRIIHNGTR